MTDRETVIGGWLAALSERVNASIATGTVDFGVEITIWDDLLEFPSGFSGAQEVDPKVSRIPEVSRV